MTSTSLRNSWHQPHINICLQSYSTTPNHPGNLCSFLSHRIGQKGKRIFTACSRRRDHQGTEANICSCRPHNSIGIQVCKYSFTMLNYRFSRDCICRSMAGLTSYNKFLHSKTNPFSRAKRDSHNFYIDRRSTHLSSCMSLWSGYTQNLACILRTIFSFSWSRISPLEVCIQYSWRSYC